MYTEQTQIQTETDTESERESETDRELNRDIDRDTDITRYNQTETETYREHVGLLGECCHPATTSSDRDRNKSGSLPGGAAAPSGSTNGFLND